MCVDMGGGHTFWKGCSQKGGFTGVHKKGGSQVVHEKGVHRGFTKRGLT